MKTSMVAWGIKVGANPGTPAQQDEMERALMGRSWVRAFPGCCVVAVEDDADRTKVRDELIAVAKKYNFVVVMSPAIAGSAGIYNGLLPPDLWPKLNGLATP